MTAHIIPANAIVTSNATTIRFELTEDTFRIKDELKARGYKFASGTWSKTASDDDAKAEIAWIRADRPIAIIPTDDDCYVVAQIAPRIAA